jgi:hypothetical protein
VFSHGKRPGGRTEAFCVKINTFQNQRKEAPDMAVFRIEETGDYTVMSNYHLRDSDGARELEAHGYLVRVRVRNENGQLGAIEYTILELPKEPAQKPVPVRENPIQVKPMSDAS